MAMNHLACSMESVHIEQPDDITRWRKSARSLLVRQIPPHAVTWTTGPVADDLFADTSASVKPDDARQLSAVKFSVPRAFMTLAETVICHADTDRFGLLYRLLWRMTHGEPRVLSNPTDGDVHFAHTLDKAVRRDMHKMKAFVRFRMQVRAGVEHYVAWFEPSHHILRRNSAFFVKRFANMNWSIVTPDGSAHWNGQALVFGPTVPREALPQEEPVEQLWLTYFSHIFNPARLRLDAMQAEMPVKYWKNLPEAPLIASLVHESGATVASMLEKAPTVAPRYAAAVKQAQAPADLALVAEQYPSAELSHSVSGRADNHENLTPDQHYQALTTAAKRCNHCSHACASTQVVFGQGPLDARVMVVGEQPGDREDLRGRPFVGPAGQLLRELMTTAGLDEDSVYFTNAVKHFKFSVRGKHRLHQKPDAGDMQRCHPWLVAEFNLVQPTLIVALGVTAAQAVLQRRVRISKEQGTWQSGPLNSDVLVTWHPAYILRQRSRGQQTEARNHLQTHLALVTERLASV